MSEIAKQLRVAAQGASKATKTIAAMKTERNREAGDLLATYVGCEPHETLEWLAASEIERLEARIEAQHKEQQEIMRINNAVRELVLELRQFAPRSWLDKIDATVR